MQPHLRQKLSSVFINATHAQYRCLNVSERRRKSNKTKRDTRVVIFLGYMNALVKKRPT